MAPLLRSQIKGQRSEPASFGVPDQDEMLLVVYLLVPFPLPPPDLAARTSCPFFDARRQIHLPKSGRQKWNLLRDVTLLLSAQDLTFKL
jgi:hypothetical protein